MPDHYDVRPSGLPQSTAVGAYEGIVPFSGIFDAILQNAAQRAYMETEGMYTAAEEAFETAQRDLRDIQMTVPQDQQADALAEYLRNTGYSSDIVEQTLGIPKEQVNAALSAAGYTVTGDTLPTRTASILETMQTGAVQPTDSGGDGAETVVDLSATSSAFS